MTEFGLLRNKDLLFSFNPAVKMNFDNLILKASVLFSASECSSEGVVNAGLTGN